MADIEETDDAFRVETEVPGADPASYEDGVLTVRVPKAEQEKARKIQIH